MSEPFDISPHLLRAGDAARLTGFVRGLARALTIVRKHHGYSAAEQEIYRTILAADEAMAAKPAEEPL